jgi:protein-tyrosine-phosphatase/DNA-binding transcriptional ArsR family regulator
VLDDVAVRAQRFAALGDPARLSIIEHLLLGDSSPGELGVVIGAATNLMAHHLRVLDDAGLVRRVRSEGDGRRTYVQLRRDDAEVRVLAELLAVHAPRPVVIPDRIVFVCTANSARSQLAAALWARQSQLPVISAGTHPAARVHPRAVQAARRHGLAVDERGTRQIGEALIGDTDLVVAVCDNAHEELVAATAPGRRRGWLHWSVADPVGPGTRAAFETAYLQLESRVLDLSRTVSEARDA